MFDYFGLILFSCDIRGWTGNDKVRVCNEDELGCAFSLETNLPANDEA